MELPTEEEHGGSWFRLLLFFFLFDDDDDDNDLTEKSSVGCFMIFLYAIIVWIVFNVSSMCVATMTLEGYWYD